MAFEIDLPRGIDAAMLRWAGMVVDAYIQRTMSVAIEEAFAPFAVQLPYFLSEAPVSITVTVLQMGDVVRLRLAVPVVAIEQNIHDYLHRYSAENDGKAVVERESKALWDRINAILSGEGLSVETLHQDRLLNRRAIEALIDLADDVARPQRATITDVFVNGRVKRGDKEFAVRWLIGVFAANLDPFERSQLSLRISENTVPAVAEDIIQLVENRKYGESRFGLLMALAKTKHPRAADVIVSVLHEKHLAWPGIEALAKLNARQHVEKVRPFLRDRNSDVRRQAKRALSKLGFPEVSRPDPIHVVRKPKIPSDSTEWSVALDMDDVEPTLNILASCVERGFGAEEIAEVVGTVDEMTLDQTRTFRFPVIVDGLDDELWLVIFLDDVDSPDLAVHSSATVIDRFRSSVTGQ